MKPAPEWLKRWRANLRRWDHGVLLALHVGARVFEDGVFCRRVGAGLSWGIYYRAPIVPGSRRTKPVQEVLLACENKTQAQGMYNTRRAEVFQGTYQPRVRRNETTLSKFLPDFVVLKKDRATAAKYEGQIKRQFIQRWGSLPLRAIKRAEVQAWYLNRITEQKVATANRELAALRVLFSEAIAADHCEVNPCKGVKTRAEHNARDRVLAEAEASALCTAAGMRDDHARPLFFLLYFTGARLSEVLELERASVDLVRATVRYVDAKSGKPRVVPMHADLVDHLRWWLEQDSRPLVFPGRRKGEHLTRPSLPWTELCAAAKVRVTPHELRHNFVSQLQVAGVADTIIMDLTGHRTLAMLKRYSHSRDHHRAAAVAKLPSVGAGQSPVNHLRLLRTDKR